MKKLVSASLILLSAGVLAACGNSSSSSKDSSSSKATSSKVEKSSSSKESSSSEATGKITRADFDAIQVGDLMTKGNGGAKLADFEAKYGKPSTTSSTTTNNVKTDTSLWSNVEGGNGATVTLAAVDGNVVSKQITKLDVSRSKELTTKDIDALATGTKFADVKAKIGEPNAMSQTNVGGVTTIVATYVTGVKGNVGAGVSLSFTNDALTTKTSTNVQ